MNMTPEAVVDAIILPHEGGTYTDDPLDAGGPTKWGITIPVLSAYRHRTCTAEDIKALTKDEATDLYIARYVRPFAGLSDPLRVNVIDMAVNAGNERATRLLQQTVGAAVDGMIGPETIGLSDKRDWNVLYTGVRLAFYEGLIERSPSQVKWRNGWRRRALSFLDASPRRTARLVVGSRAVFGHMGKAA